MAALRQAAVEHSRNTDAHDIDLDGEIAADVERRLLERAEAVGRDRARDYLAERLDALKDTWRQHRDGTATLGFRGETRKDTVIAGLLRPADGTRWGVMTVPMSMRETEHEINLLVTGRDHAAGAAPDWDFGARAEAGTSAGGDGEVSP